MALGTLTHAVPLLQRDAGVNARTTDVASGTDKTHTLQFVLNDVTAKLNDKLNPVVQLTNATVDTIDIKDVLSDTIKVLDDAVKLVNDLVKYTLDDVLKGVDNVALTVEDVLDLVAAIVKVVFQALQQVINTVEDLTSLFEILGEVVQAVQPNPSGRQHY